MCGAPHLQWPVSCTQHILRARVLVFGVFPRMSWTLCPFFKNMWWSLLRGQWFCCTLEFFLCLCPQVSLLGWALGPLLFLLTHVVCSTHGVDCPLHPTHSFGQSVSIWGVPQDELDPWSILSTLRVWSMKAWGAFGDPCSFLFGLACCLGLPWPMFFFVFW